MSLDGLMSGDGTKPGSGADRRRHRRVPWSAGLRGVAPGGVEFHGRTIEVGARGLSLRTRRRLTPGDRVSLHLDEVGRIEAEVAWELTSTDYTLIFRSTPEEQDRIADQLTWLINRDGLSLEDDRSDPRRTTPADVTVAFDNGQVSTCTVLDLSVFGIALSTADRIPDLGEVVRIGDRLGECIRHLDRGFAVGFHSGARPARP
ncbi:MAG: PilZ domain-containing protein [Alphaproteobacteria bacterium]|nr:PilZ domain-containing protein [Alphaproteobacteria bacterium]